MPLDHLRCKCAWCGTKQASEFQRFTCHGDLASAPAHEAQVNMPCRPSRL